MFDYRHLLLLLLGLQPIALFADALSPGSGRECVILLHGLARTRHSMSRLEMRLRDAGYHSVNQGYPSRHKPVQLLAEEAIPGALRRCRGADTKVVHFVTHSLGGILLRYYLRQHHIPELGRVVMLSPPNQGSEVADRLKHKRFYRWFNGPAGQQLGTDADSLPARLGPVTYPVGIITGDRHAFFDSGLARMIPGADDGKVAVERAKLQGMRDFLVVHRTHPFIMDAEEVILQCLYFLRHGRFKQGGIDGLTEPVEPQG